MNGQEAVIFVLKHQGDVNSSMQAPTQNTSNSSVADATFVPNYSRKVIKKESLSPWMETVWSII